MVGKANLYHNFLTDLHARPLSFAHPSSLLTPPPPPKKIEQGFECAPFASAQALTCAGAHRGAHAGSPVVRLLGAEFNGSSMLIFFPSLCQKKKTHCQATEFLGQFHIQQPGCRGRRGRRCLCRHFRLQRPTQRPTRRKIEPCNRFREERGRRRRKKDMG